MIDAQTRLYGLLGQPLGHSLSPLIQNAFLEQTQVNGVYLALPVQAGDLQSVVQGLWAMGVAGCNVTIPYKEAIIPYVVGLTQEAEVSRAVNTLIRTERGFVGDNTDGAGFLAALADAYQWQASGRRILLVGAGGAAKGVAVAMALAGAEQILIANRHRPKAAELCRLIGQNSRTQAEVLTLEQLANPALYEQVDTIVNGTSLGMSPHVAQMPPIATEALDQRHLVVDLIYNPAETRLLQLAAGQGAKTCSGLGMLIRQGALSFERWTGIRPDLRAVTELVRARLQSGKKISG